MSALGSFIWSIADQPRGPYSPADADGLADDLDVRRDLPSRTRNPRIAR